MIAAGTWVQPWNFVSWETDDWWIDNHRTALKQLLRWVVWLKSLGTKSNHQTAMNQVGSAVLRSLYGGRRWETCRNEARSHVLGPKGKPLMVALASPQVVTRQAEVENCWAEFWSTAWIPWLKRHWPRVLRLLILVITGGSWGWWSMVGVFAC